MVREQARGQGTGTWSGSRHVVGEQPHVQGADSTCHVPVGAAARLTGRSGSQCWTEEAGIVSQSSHPFITVSHQEL